MREGAPREGDTESGPRGIWTFLRCPDERWGWCRLEGFNLRRADGTLWRLDEMGQVDEVGHRLVKLKDGREAKEGQMVYVSDIELYPLPPLSPFAKPDGEA